MDVSNLRPLLRVVSGAGDPDDDDHARHDQRREDDDKKVGDEVICPFNKTIVASTSRLWRNVPNFALCQ